MLITNQGETNSNCMDLDDSDAELIYNTTKKLCEIKAQLATTCFNDTNLKEANITLKSVHCTTDQPPIQPSVTATHAEITTQPICKCQTAGSVASIGLGAAVGLLVALLAVVTIGWMWTCWTIKRRGRITINSRNIR